MVNKKKRRSKTKADCIYTAWRIIINNTALNYIEYTLEYCIVSPKN